MKDKKVKKSILKVMLHSLEMKLIRIIDDGKEVTKIVLKKDIDKLWKENILNSAEIVQYLKNKYIDLKDISIGIDRGIVKSTIEQRRTV